MGWKDSIVAFAGVGTSALHTPPLPEVLVTTLRCKVLPACFGMLLEVVTHSHATVAADLGICVMCGQERALEASTPPYLRKQGPHGTIKPYYSTEGA